MGENLKFIVYPNTLKMLIGTSPTFDVTIVVRRRDLIKRSRLYDVTDDAVFFVCLTVAVSVETLTQTDLYNIHI